MDQEAKTDESSSGSIRVEVSLSVPQAKIQVSAQIDMILADLKISYESDLFSLSYACDKNKESPQVQKVMIHFKSNKVGELFYKNIIEEYKEHFQNIIKNTIDCEEIETCRSPRWSLSSADESIYVVNENCSYIEKDLLELETIFYDQKNLSGNKSQSMEPFDDSELEFISSEHLEDMPPSIKESATETFTLCLDSGNSSSTSNLDGSNDLMLSTVETSAIKKSVVEKTDDVDTDNKTLSCHSIEEPVIETEVPNDKYLYIVSDKAFDSSSQSDAIIILFENETATGGGEIVDWELSESSKPWFHHWQIVIKYRTKLAYNNVLMKRLFKFEDFTLEVHSECQVKKNRPPKDPKAFILTDCNATYPQNVIQMLAESLVQNSNNYIETIVKSEVFLNTYIITFKSDINIESIEEKFHQCSLYNICKLPIQAELTKCLVLKARTGSFHEFIKEPVEIQNMKIHDYNSGLQILQFKTDEDLREGYTNIQKIIDLKEYAIEPYYSFVLPCHEINCGGTTISDGLNETYWFTPEDPVTDSKKFQPITSKGLIIGLVLLLSFMLFKSPQTKSTSQNDAERVFSVIPPFMILNAQANANYKVLNYFYETEFDRFAEDLLDFNTIPLWSKESPYFTLMYSENLDDSMSEEEYQSLKKDWIANLDKFLENYFNLFDTKILLVDRSVIEGITYNRLRVNIKQLEGYKNTKFRYEISGYRDSVNDFVNKIKLENLSHNKQ